MPWGLLLKRDGVRKGDGWEAGAGRDARLWGLVQSTPRCPIQWPIVAPGVGTPVERVIGFAQPVVEGRGVELQFPAGNAEPWLFAFLISRCLDCRSPRFRGQGCNYSRGTFRSWEHLSLNKNERLYSLWSSSYWYLRKDSSDDLVLISEISLGIRCWDNFGRHPRLLDTQFYFSTIIKVTF